MDLKFGTIEVPLSLVEEIEERLQRAWVDFELKFKGHYKPTFIILNRMAFGALKARTRKIQDFYISHSLSLTDFRGATIVCNPMQGELIKCLLDPEQAFYYQDFE